MAKPSMIHAASWGNLYTGSLSAGQKDGGFQIGNNSKEYFEIQLTITVYPQVALSPLRGVRIHTGKWQGQTEMEQAPSYTFPCTTLHVVESRTFFLPPASNYFIRMINLDTTYPVDVQATASYVTLG